MLVYAVEGVGTYMYVYVVCQKIKIMKKPAPTDKQNKREIKEKILPASAWNIAQCPMPASRYHPCTSSCRAQEHLRNPFFNNSNQRRQATTS